MQTKQKIKLARFVMFISFIALMFISGCARYARNVNVLYEPTTTLRGVGGDLYVVIPESRWLIGGLCGFPPGGGVAHIDSKQGRLNQIIIKGDHKNVPNKTGISVQNCS